jgi:hypothetical protein
MIGKNGGIPPFPITSSWHVMEQIYILNILQGFKNDFVL